MTNNEIDSQFCPKVSVIITNYNHGKYLKQSIESIKRQTYKNFEIILIDDGSTDPYTKEVLDEISWEDDSITTILNETNKGKWAVLNQVIENITTPYFMVHDADDVALAQKLEVHVKAIEKLGSCHTLVGFHHCHTEEDVEKHWNEIYDLSNIDSLILDHKHTYNSCRQSRLNPQIGHYVASMNYEVHGGACMYKTQKWRDGLKFTPPDMNLRIQKAEDSDLNSKFTLLLQKTSVVKLPLYCYRRNVSTNDSYKRGL